MENGQHCSPHDSMRWGVTNISPKMSDLSHSVSGIGICGPLWVSLCVCVSGPKVLAMSEKLSEKQKGGSGHEGGFHTSRA